MGQHLVIPTNSSQARRFGTVATNGRLLARRKGRDEVGGADREGAKPGDPPMHQPSTLEVVITLKPTTALGIDSPAALVARWPNNAGGLAA